MLGGFLLLRRAMLDELGGLDEGFRLYGEDIDLAYRAMQAGWERWYVPGRRRPPRAPGGDRQALADAAHALALGGHRPLRPQASREAARAVSADGVLEKFDRHSPTGYSRARRTPTRSATRRAARSVIVELGPRLEPGETVLDLGCGDAIMAAPARRATACATAASTRARGCSRRRAARNPGAPVRGSAGSRSTSRRSPSTRRFCLRTFYHPADRVAFFRHVAGYTRASSSSTSGRAPTRPGRSSPTCARPASGSIELRPFFLPQRRRAARARSLPLVTALERDGPARLARPAPLREAVLRGVGLT